MMKYFQLYERDMAKLEKVSDPAKRWALIRAAADYAYSDEEPDFSDDPLLDVIWMDLREGIDIAKGKAAARAEAGGKGGRAKQTEAQESKPKQTEANESKPKQTKANESKAAYTEPDPEPETETETEPERENPRRRGRAREGGALLSPGWFDRFWEAYPRKVSKEDARKAFARAHIDGETLEREVLPGLEAWKRCRQWQDAEYVPYPATWLNQRRWKERPEPAGEKPRTVTAQQYSQRSYADEGGDDVREYMQRHGIDLRVAQA